MLKRLVDFLITLHFWRGIHRVHMRVLEHIKVEAEAGKPAPPETDLGGGGAGFG